MNTKNSVSKTMKAIIMLVLFVPIIGIAQYDDVSFRSEKNPDPHGREETAISGMPSNTVFVVLDITVHDSILYQEYRMKVAPIIKEYGGKYTVRSGGMAFDADPDRKVIQVEGNWNPNRFIVIRWDSLEQMEAFSTSEAYQKIVPLRTNSASTKSIIVKEYNNY